VNERYDPSLSTDYIKYESTARHTGEDTDVQAIMGIVTALFGGFLLYIICRSPREKLSIDSDDQKYDPDEISRSLKTNSSSEHGLPLLIDDVVSDDVKSNEAAIIIQRAYKLYKLVSMSNSSHTAEPEGNSCMTFADYYQYQRDHPIGSIIDNVGDIIEYSRKRKTTLNKWHNLTNLVPVGEQKKEDYGQGDGHGHGHGYQQIPFWARPVQRQRWGEAQVSEDFFIF
jgi:hypothetical protein